MRLFGRITKMGENALAMLTMIIGFGSACDGYKGNGEDCPGILD